MIQAAASPVDTAARTLARFAANLDFRDIPQLDAERAKQCVIDTVGVTLLGARLPWARIAARYARHYGEGGTSRIIGTPGGVAAPMAALANGVAAHAFELDSLRKPGVGVHPGAALVPVALALGDELHRSGSEVLTAFVAGCEVMFRIGMASKHSSEQLGFHAPGLTGPFGAAVTAGRLLGLDTGPMCRAIGIAGSLGGGLLAFAKADNGAMVKRLHLGRAAEAGILAARLAQDGFEGPDTILEGGNGFLQVYCRDADPSLLAQSLGKRFETRNLCIKRYACHITAHTPVQSIQALRAEHGFGSDEVKAVTVRASAKVVSHHSTVEPRDVMAAQYSVPFCVAVALVGDPLDPEAFGERGLNDARVRAVSRRVSCEAWPDAPSSWASEVLVELDDGRSFSRAADDFKGTPTQPLSHDELSGKFLRCAGDFAYARRLLEQLERLATLDDVSALMLA